MPRYKAIRHSFSVQDLTFLSSLRGTNEMEDTYYDQIRHLLKKTGCENMLYFWRTAIREPYVPRVLTARDREVDADISTDRGYRRFVAEYAARR